VVSAVAGLPLLEVPAGHLKRPDLMWAERLPVAALAVSDTEVRIQLPGRDAFLVDAQRDPVQYAVLAEALADPAPGGFPLAGPVGESRRLAAAGARRCGLTDGTRRGPLADLPREDLSLLLAHVDEDHAARVRNWAYMLTGLFTACRHAELSRFMLESIEETPQGFTVWVDHTKNYPEGKDFAVRHAGEDPLTCSHPLCPACALRRQRDLVRGVHGRTHGPVFATRYGGRWCVMSRQNGGLIVKDLWDRAGLPKGKRVATRSLRAGGITSASEERWERWRIADELSGHRDLNVLEVYVRKLDPFSDEFFLPV
jgi:integrase